MNRKTEYLHLRPYRAIPAPKLRSQKERDALAYGNTKRSTIIYSSEPPPSRRRYLYAAVTLLVIVLARWLWFHYP